jgi:hypothetical protein
MIRAKNPIFFNAVDNNSEVCRTLRVSDEEFVVDSFQFGNAVVVFHGLFTLLWLLNQALKRSISIMIRRLTRMIADSRPLVEEWNNIHRKALSDGYGYLSAYCLMVKNFGAHD